MDRYRGGSSVSSSTMMVDMGTPMGSESTSCQSPWGPKGAGAFDGVAYNAQQLMEVNKESTSSATTNTPSAQRFSRKDAHERLHIAKHL